MSHITMKKALLHLMIALLPYAASAQPAQEPYGALPSERQLRWHEMEMYCLIHYTPIAFQDKGVGESGAVLQKIGNVSFWATQSEFYTAVDGNAATLAQILRGSAVSLYFDRLVHTKYLKFVPTDAVGRKSTLLNLTCINNGSFYCNINSPIIHYQCVWSGSENVV